RWKQRYKPISSIKEEWYENLTEEITSEEWAKALESTKNNSAPGPSGITYPLIKRASMEAEDFFRKLGSECLRKGTMPRKWKAGLLYPIPKREDWGYKLDNVRPILLLETFRKMVVRVLNNRLGKTLKEKKVLKGRNFAGLPEESTSAPIQLINCMME